LNTTEANALLQQKYNYLWDYQYENDCHLQTSDHQKIQKKKMMKNDELTALNTKGFD